QNEARRNIARMRLKDLDLNQFRVGARKSAKAAIDNFTKGRFDEAFVNKGKEALNIQMIKETHVAYGKANRVFKFAKKFNKADVIQDLKDAGPTFVNAANEILDSFHLSGSKKGLVERDSFQKWVKQQYEIG